MSKIAEVNPSIRMGEIDPVILGKRIAAARKSRAISQEEMARRLDVSRPTAIAIEKGTRALKPNEIILVAEMLGQHIHELLATSREYVQEFAPQFRMTQVAQVTQDAANVAQLEFQQACEDYLTLENKVGAPLAKFAYPIPYSVEGISPQSAAEEVVSLERSRLNLGQGPISNIMDVLENEVGLRVFVLPIQEFRIAGMYAYTERLGGCILVNGNHPATRQTWSAAHELGHFLTDRFQNGVTLIAEYGRKPRSEQFADAFAASFLMPGAGLRQRFRRIVQSKEDFTVADLCLLADQYSVSVEAMTRRLEHLGCVARGMWTKISIRGFEAKQSNMREQLGLDTPNPIRKRLPERYCRLAVQAFEEEEISEGQLARYLRCNRVEAREIVDFFTRPSEVDSEGQPYQLALDFGATVELSGSERD